VFHRHRLHEIKGQRGRESFLAQDEIKEKNNGVREPFRAFWSGRILMAQTVMVPDTFFSEAILHHEAALIKIRPPLVIVSIASPEPYRTVVHEAPSSPSLPRPDPIKRENELDVRRRTRPSGQSAT